MRSAFVRGVKKGPVIRCKTACTTFAIDHFCGIVNTGVEIGSHISFVQHFQVVLAAVLPAGSLCPGEVKFSQEMTSGPFGKTSTIGGGGWKIGISKACIA